jgi:putative spermidine/putrescine transport system substrate-binding protein
MKEGRGIDRRSFLQVGATAIMLAPVAARRAAAQENTITVNTWGGSWTAAEEVAYFKPFTEKTGIKVTTVAPVSFAKLKAQVQTRNYEWDVSTINPPEVKQAELEGLLEPIDWSVVNKANFGPNQIASHSIGGVALATGLAYRKDKFPGGGPKSWADFWDVKHFVGTRSLYNRSFTSLSFALLADGVAADRLYPMDLERGFKKLDQIKPHIKIWWTQANQSQQLIRDGEVDMMAMWNARANELAEQGLPVEFVWNQAESYGSNWFVAKGTPRAKNAWRFIDFAAQAKPQADFCMRLSYGPLNPKAFELIPADQARKMPTYPEHLKIGFTPDAAWLGPNLPKIRERFSQWLTT